MGQLLSSPVTAAVVERHGSPCFRAASASMQGWRISMEDAHVCMCSWGGPTKGHFSVFDGHGGEKSAKYCGIHLEKELQSLQNYSAAAIQETFISMDRKLKQHLQKDQSGCTCISAIVSFSAETNKYSLQLANIGDSRAILIKQPKRGQESEVLGTIDHKPDDEAEKKRICAAGGFVSASVPARLDGAISLSRAFGDFEYKQNPDFEPKDQKMSVFPDVYNWTASRGDVLVLACDGVFDVMTNQELATLVTNLMSETKDMGDVCKQVLEDCLEKGSRDNMTVVLVQLSDGVDHERFPELVLGGFFKETYKSVRDKYIEFAQDSGFSLEDPKLCQVCGKLFQNMSSCACKNAIYCGRECQKSDWKSHKQMCSARPHKDLKDSDAGTDSNRSESSKAN
eukprot:c8080_g1_i3.p1 GENE.c8080_g1_i3~~c8080_g1_i3.p1  ORF type:complete len:411 (+),score=92.98 c8080_g1_i3:46-1233(+)